MNIYIHTVASCLSGWLSKISKWASLRLLLYYCFCTGSQSMRDFCPCPLRVGSLLSMPSHSPMCKPCSLQSCMFWGFTGGSVVKNLPTMQNTCIRSLGQEGPPEQGMVTHSRILAWRIPWTEEPGGLQSMGSQRARHNLTMT